MSDEIIQVEPMDPTLENSPVSKEAKSVAPEGAAAASSSACKHNSKDYSYGAKICMEGTVHECDWDGYNPYWKDTGKKC